MSSHRLTAGADIYDLTDFGPGGYILSLKPEFNDIGEYGSFTVLGIAEGGAFATASGNMRIVDNEYDCTIPTLVDGLTPNLINLSDFEGEEATLFDSSETYITIPDSLEVSGCVFTFTLELIDG